MLQKTEEAIRMNNPETLGTLGTQDTAQRHTKQTKYNTENYKYEQHGIVSCKTQLVMI